MALIFKLFHVQLTQKHIKFLNFPLFLSLPLRRSRVANSIEKFRQATIQIGTIFSTESRFNGKLRFQLKTLDPLLRVVHRTLQNSLETFVERSFRESKFNWKFVPERKYVPWVCGQFSWGKRLIILHRDSFGKNFASLPTCFSSSSLLTDF